MFNESFPFQQNTEPEVERNTDIKVMKHGPEFDPESTDIKYEKIDSDSPEGSSLINDCDWLLSNCYEDTKNGKYAESFVGSGFHAVVLRDTQRKFCMKMSWETLFFNYKFKPGMKNFDLPDRLVGLHKIYQYFNGSPTQEGINEKRRRMTTAGMEYKPQNSIEEEAKITEYVYKQFEKVGIVGVTPEVLSVFKYENSEEGSSENLKTFSVSENVHAIHLKYIDGITIEQLILENPDEFSEKIDVIKFIFELKRLVEIMHGFNVTHGDLTIRNVMIDRESMMPRIIDFGGAKFSKNHADQDEVADDMESIENISKLLQSYGIDPIKTQQSLKERRNKL